MLNVKLTIAVLVIVISIYTPILQIEIRKTVSKFERYQIPTITPPALLAPSDNLNPPPIVRGNFAKPGLQILSGASTSIDRVNLSRH